MLGGSLFWIVQWVSGGGVVTNVGVSLLLSLSLLASSDTTNASCIAKINSSKSYDSYSLYQDPCDDL